MKNQSVQYPVIAPILFEQSPGRSLTCPHCSVAVNCVDESDFLTSVVSHPTYCGQLGHLSLDDVDIQDIDFVSLFARAHALEELSFWIADEVMGNLASAYRQTPRV